MSRFPVTCSRPSLAHQNRVSQAYAAPFYSIYEKDGAYVVELDMPGVDRSSIDVHVEGQSLKVHAERTMQTPEGYTSLFSEFNSRSYDRQFEIGKHIDLEHVDARYENGVLQLVLQKKPEASPRRITIN